MELFNDLLNPANYIPHGYCITWSRPLLFTLAASDLVIFAAYLSIPLAMAQFARKRPEIPFKRLLAMFAAFILACGLTHLAGVMTLWYPAYVLEAGLKLVTALLSCLTAYWVWRLLPEALRLQSTDRLLEAQHLAEMGSWDLDLVSGRLTWSEGVFRLFEIDSNKFKATYEAFLEAVHPEDRKQVDQTYTDSLRNRMPYEITHRLLMADGRIKWVTERGKSFFATDGKPLRSIGTVQDITRRKLAEIALQETHRLLQTIIDTAPVRIFWKDRESRFLGCNRLLARDAGLDDPAAMIGKDDSQMAWSEQAGLYRADDRRVMESGTTKLSYVEPQTTPAGATIWLSTSKTPLRNAAGETIGILGVYDDITQRVVAEQQLVESREQLRELSAHQERLLEEERKRIAGEIHDELGQQLTALRLDIALLRQQYPDLPGLGARTLEMNAILDEAIEFSRHIAENLRPGTLDLGIVPAIQALADKFGTRWNIECAIVASDRAADLPDSCAIAVFRIVQEALTNVARHATASRVEIAIETGGNGFILRIRDNGIGFAVEPALAGGRHGLIGMRERALAVGGKLVIESVPGHGTTLVLTLAPEALARPDR